MKNRMIDCVCPCCGKDHKMDADDAILYGFECDSCVAELEELEKNDE